MGKDSGLRAESMFQLWNGFIMDYLPYAVRQTELAVLEHAVRLSLYRGSTGFELPAGMRFGDVGQYFSEDGESIIMDTRFHYYKPLTVKRAVAAVVKAGFLIKRPGSPYRRTRYTVNLPGILKLISGFLGYEWKHCSTDTADLRVKSLRKEYSPLANATIDYYRKVGIVNQGVKPVMSTDQIQRKMREALERSADSRKRQLKKIRDKKEMTVPDMFRVITGLCEDNELPYRERRTGEVRGKAKNFLKEKGTTEARSLLERAINKWHLFYHSLPCARLQKDLVLTEAFSFELFYNYRMEVEAWLDENEQEGPIAINCKLAEDDTHKSSSTATRKVGNRIYEVIETNVGGN